MSVTLTSPPCVRIDEMTAVDVVADVLWHVQTAGLQGIKAFQNSRFKNCSKIAKSKLISHLKMPTLTIDCYKSIYAEPPQSHRW